MLFFLPFIIIINLGGVHGGNLPCKFTHNNTFEHCCYMDSKYLVCTHQKPVYNENYYTTYTHTKNMTMCDYHMCVTFDDQVACSAPMFKTVLLLPWSHYYFSPGMNEGSLTSAELYNIWTESGKSYPNDYVDGYNIRFAGSYMRNFDMSTDTSNPIVKTVCSKFTTQFHLKNGEVFTWGLEYAPVENFWSFIISLDLSMIVCLFGIFFIQYNNIHWISYIVVMVIDLFICEIVLFEVLRFVMKLYMSIAGIFLGMFITPVCVWFLYIISNEISFLANSIRVKRNKHEIGISESDNDSDSDESNDEEKELKMKL